MSTAVEETPMDLLRFVNMENEQFLVSLANGREEFGVASHLQGLFNAAMSNITAPEDDMVVFTLLTFTHYHFLFSTASLMRCHLSEAFASARAAIDGALIGAHIIHDRASQVAYTRREKPFDNFARHLGNLIRGGKALPHPLVPVLFNLHKKISGFASHADVGSFVHRVNISRETGDLRIVVDYFQYSKSGVERKIHAFNLFHAFVMILDVFSDFLVIEQKAVPKEWQDDLRKLGGAIESRVTELKKDLPHAG